MAADKISLDRIEHGILDLLPTLYDEDAVFPYRLQANLGGSLYGTCFACFIAHLFNKSHVLNGREKIIAALISLPVSKEGLIDTSECRDIGLSNSNGHTPLYVQLQTTTFVRAALRALGTQPLGNVRWALRIAEKPGIKKWLYNLPWINPWLASNLDMFLGIFLLELQSSFGADSLACSALEQYFCWHNEMQDSKTGFWGSQIDIHNAMAGAYHIVLHYDYANRTLKHIEEMIDSILCLPWRDGLFVHGGGGGSCEDLDAIDLMIRLSLVSKHRAEQVRTTVLQACNRIANGQNSDGGFGWRIMPKPSQILSAIFHGRFGLARMIATSLIFGLMHRSHLSSIHYYSSCQSYPYRINKSDLWSCWFRPLALALAAQRYPEAFYGGGTWSLPDWPGLGYNPFRRSDL